MAGSDRRRKPAILGWPPASPQPMFVVRPQIGNPAGISRTLRQVLGGDVLTNNGPRLRAFEASLSERLGCEVACTSSGTVALLLTLKALGIVDGEVVMPSYTFCAVPHAVCWGGSAPCFADVTMASASLSATSVANAIEARTRAILTVDNYGVPSDYAPLRRLADAHQIPLIVDSASSFGARRDGELIGRQGYVHCFSFHATKPFTTVEGGAVTSSDRHLVQEVRKLRNFGLEADGDCVVDGINGKMSEVSAVIGLSELETIDDLLEKRRAIASKYAAFFASQKNIYCIEWDHRVDSSWPTFPVFLRGEFMLSRDEMLFCLQKENMFFKPYYSVPCHKMRVYSESAAVDDLSVTNMVARRVISLPLYSGMTNDEFDLVTSALGGILHYQSEIRDVLDASRQRLPESGSRLQSTTVDAMPPGLNVEPLALNRAGFAGGSHS